MIAGTPKKSVLRRATTSPPPGNGPDRGFTLVELLVATVLLAVVMAAVYSLFHTVIQVWRSGEADGGHARRTRHVVDLISRDYHNAFPPAGHLMSGDGHTVAFISAATPLLAEDRATRRLFYVRYVYDPAQGTLTREEALLDGPLPPGTMSAVSLTRAPLPLAEPKQTVVATGIDEWTFAYLWMPDEEGMARRSAPTKVSALEAAYHNRSWGFPQALALRFQFAAGDATPAYTAALRIPTRGVNQRRKRRQLERILGDALL